MHSEAQPPKVDRILPEALACPSQNGLSDRARARFTCNHPRTANLATLATARSDPPGLSAERHVDKLGRRCLGSFRPSVVAGRRRRAGGSGEGLDHGEIGAGLEGCEHE